MVCRKLKILNKTYRSRNCGPDLEDLRLASKTQCAPGDESCEGTAAKHQVKVIIMECASMQTMSSGVQLNYTVWPGY